MEQYRAVIGLCQGRVVWSRVKKDQGAPIGFGEICLASGVIIILLIIGGVEMNPGPLDQEDMKKLKDLFKEVLDMEMEGMRKFVSSEMREVKSQVEVNRAEVGELREVVMDLETRLKKICDNP